MDDAQQVYATPTQIVPGLTSSADSIAEGNAPKTSSTSRVFHARGVVVNVLPTVPRGSSFDEADIPADKRASALRDERFLVE